MSQYSALTTHQKSKNFLSFVIWPVQEKPSKSKVNISLYENFVSNKENVEKLHEPYKEKISIISPKVSLDQYIKQFQNNPISKSSFFPLISAPM